VERFVCACESGDGGRIMSTAVIVDRVPASVRALLRRCRMKLPASVESDHRAFCTPGCYAQYFRRRCVVCERPIERRTEHQRLCGRRKCRNTLRQWPHVYAPPVSRGYSEKRGRRGVRASRGRSTPISAHFTGLKTGLAPIRAPAQALAVEVWGGRASWEPAISSDGVAVEVSRLRPRALTEAAS
jgi:hypothetical protein